MKLLYKLVFHTTRYHAKRRATAFSAEVTAAAICHLVLKFVHNFAKCRIHSEFRHWTINFTAAVTSGGEASGEAWWRFKLMLENFRQKMKKIASLYYYKFKQSAVIIILDDDNNYLPYLTPGTLHTNLVCDLVWRSVRTRLALADN